MQHDTFELRPTDQFINVTVLKEVYKMVIGLTSQNRRHITWNLYQNSIKREEIDRATNWINTFLAANVEKDMFLTWLKSEFNIFRIECTSFEWELGWSFDSAWLMERK